MKLRVIAIILLFSLLLFFGFKKISANKNNELSTNIEQLNILKYIPEKNKLLFISNLDNFNIINNNQKFSENFILLHLHSIFNQYLGIDVSIYLLHPSIPSSKFHISLTILLSKHH